MAKLKLRAALRRAMFKSIGNDIESLRADQARRFRNALLAIVLCDPRWMMWIERDLPPRMDEIWQDMDIWLALVEAAARWKVLAQYCFFYRRFVASLVFRTDQPFTDRGTLSPG